MILLPIVPRAESGWYLVVPLLVAGSGLGLLVSQLNNYTLSPISEERVSEAAGVNSAAGSFGLSFGLAFAGALMLATLSFDLHRHGRGQRRAAPRRAAAGRRVAGGRRRADEQHPARGVARRPARADVQDEIVRINTDARPLALQVALLVPIVAALLGLIDAFRMMRLPDPEPAEAARRPGMVASGSTPRGDPPGAASERRRDVLAAERSGST